MCLDREADDDEVQENDDNFTNASKIKDGPYLEKMAQKIQKSHKPFKKDSKSSLVTAAIIIVGLAVCAALIASAMR